VTRGRTLDNNRRKIHGIHSWNKRSNVVALIVFRDRVCTESYEDKLQQKNSIFLENNPSYHSMMNHIHVQYHFMRDMVEINKVFLEKVDTLENIADSLTKSVRFMKFSWCGEAMGIATLGLLIELQGLLYQKIIKQVGECWVFILFVVK
jgi:hypothetical protein